MAKRKKLGTPATKGWYRAGIGKVRMIGGVTRAPRWYTSKDEAVHLQTVKAIRSRWLYLKAQGHLFWPEEEIGRLIADGLIRAPLNRTRHDLAMARIVEGGEPLSQAELRPFVDDSGLPKPEAVIPLYDLMGRKLWSRLDIRSNFFRQLYEDALKDPKATFEWCVRNLGWNGKDASKFLFNVTGNLELGAIAYDESEAPPPKPAMGNAIDPLQDIIEIDPQPKN